MLPLFLLITFLSLVGGQRGFDCDTLACNPCENGNGEVDYLFLVDATGSMQEEIDGFGSGLAAFATEINTRGLDARFAIIVYGWDAELILDWTSDSTLVESIFGQIRAASSTNVNYLHDWVEAGFELIRMSLNAAPYSAFTRCDCQLTWRSGALRYLLLVGPQFSCSPFANHTM